jgi:hypothetical protein
MLRYERDYVLRMIAAAAAAVARLRGRLRGGGVPDEILREVLTSQSELLGKNAPLFRALDPTSAAHALGDKDLVAAWADLLRVEAEARRLSGDVQASNAAEARADALEKLARSPAGLPT